MVAPVLVLYLRRCIFSFEETVNLTKIKPGTFIGIKNAVLGIITGIFSDILLVYMWNLSKFDALSYKCSRSSKGSCEYCSDSVILLPVERHADISTYNASILKIQRL